jgi:hypothetical protein
MRWIIFKVVSFCAVFIFALEIIFPWLMASTSMPVWLAVLLVSLNIVTAVALIDRITLRLITTLREPEELI